MKAAVCYGNGIVKYEDINEPKVSDNEVKIKVMACGICGSDIPRALETKAHYYPIVLGHEFSGVVCEVGKNVADIEIGEHVTAAPLIPCNDCIDCKNGNYSLCKNYSFIGSRQQGAMAEYLVVPKENVVKIGNTSFEKGALFEPATVGLHAFFCCNYQPNKNVAIMGGGTIGIFAMQWAKILGCKRVVVFGRDKEHLQLALKLGADEVISTLEPDFQNQAFNYIKDSGFDYVFECVGSEKTIKYSLELAKNKATVCYIGTPERDISFGKNDWCLINRKELTLNGSWMSYSENFPGKEWIMTKEAFENGSLKFDEEIFYKKISISKTDEAFELFKNKKQKVKGRILLSLQEGQ